MGPPRETTDAGLGRFCPPNDGLSNPTWLLALLALLVIGDSVEERRWKRIKKLVVDDLLFSPLAGWLARGSAAVDSLRTFLPRVSGFGISPFDFDASGAMAFIYGSVSYQLGSGATRDMINADATIVLVQRGDTWKIRSHVERPRPTPDL